jgi:hypothetical protein
LSDENTPVADPLQDAGRRQSIAASEGKPVLPAEAGATPTPTHGEQKSEIIAACPTTTLGFFGFAAPPVIALIGIFATQFGVFTIGTGLRSALAGVAVTAAAVGALGALARDEGDTGEQVLLVKHGGASVAVSSAGLAAASAYSSSEFVVALWVTFLAGGLLLGWAIRGSRAELCSRRQRQFQDASVASAAKALPSGPGQDEDADRQVAGQ